MLVTIIVEGNPISYSHSSLLKIKLSSIVSIFLIDITVLHTNTAISNIKNKQEKNDVIPPNICDNVFLLNSNLFIAITCFYSAEFPTVIG